MRPVAILASAFFIAVLSISVLADAQYGSYGQASATTATTTTTSATSTEKAIPVASQSERSKGQCQGTFQGFVKKTVDGETITIEGCNRRVSLALVEVPDRMSNRAVFRAARSFTRELCPAGQLAIVDQDKKRRYDQHGQIVAVVYCNSKSLNAEIVYKGLANVDTRYCKSSEFAEYDWARGPCGV